jgi:hypothetical protein
MSCCNSTPRRVNYIINCNPDCPDVQDWVFSNANVEGQGVFFQQEGTSVEFYGLMNTDGYLTVSLDAVNKAISIDLDADLIAGSIPDATTTVKGKVELATDAEAQAKTDTARAITPSNLAAVTASTTTTGLVELATSPETVTGTDTQRATTPAGVKAALDSTKAIQVVGNDAGRAGATPAFLGQQLYQSDTAATYVGTALVAGGWVGPFLALGTSYTTLGGNSGLNTDGNTFLFDGSGTVGFASNIDLVSGAFLMNGAAIPDSLIGDVGGVFGSYPVANFLNNSRTQTYTVTNPTTSRTFDADTVTVQQLADVVATLIQDFSDLYVPTIPA